MDIPHIRDQIFDPLNHKTVLICRQVCQFWNESLARMFYIKLLQEFGDRHVIGTDQKVSTFIAGWKKAVKNFVFQASLEDLQEVKRSLEKLGRGTGKCCEYPIHEAVNIGAVKLMEFLFRTSYDMNTKNTGWKDTALHLACEYGRTEIAQLILQYSKDLGIDLNAKNCIGRTAWHLACLRGKIEIAQLILQYSKDSDIDLNAKDKFGGCTAFYLACYNGQTETVRMILKIWKEFGIDLKAQDNDGRTPLDLKIYRIYENSFRTNTYENDKIRKMLEKEYSQIDVTESVQSLNLDN